MRDNQKLPLMLRLASVQRAKRLAAEAQMNEAASAAQKAAAADAVAMQLRTDAEGEWTDYLGRPSFTPEFARALSAQLIDRAEEASQAAERKQKALNEQSEKQQAWRVLEAGVRQSDGSIRKLRRQVARRTDEKRLAELGDRTTYAWSRR